MGVAGQGSGKKAGRNDALRRPCPPVEATGSRYSITRALFNAGGRRFALTIATQISVTVLMWLGKIDAASFRDIVIGTVGIYVAGNTAQKIKAGSNSE